MNVIDRFLHYVSFSTASDERSEAVPSTKNQLVLAHALCEELKIQCGETTEDGMFTLQDVACLGCCSLSPAMMINGNTYGSLTPDKAIRIVRDLKKGAEA